MRTDVIGEFDVPRMYTNFKVELDPDGQVDAHVYILQDGDERTDDPDVLVDDAVLSYTVKTYIEIRPDDPTVVDVTVSYVDRDGDEAIGIDTREQVRVGEQLWFDLRGGTSKVGIDRPP